MMPPRIDGFMICQSLSAAFVTVTKSAPKNTRSTPSIANSRRASGELRALSVSAKSCVPFSMTTRPGRNFRVDGLGVCSVWINKTGSPWIGRCGQNAPRRSELGAGRHRPRLLPSDLGTEEGRIKMILGLVCIIVMDYWTAKSSCLELLSGATLKSAMRDAKVGSEQPVDNSPHP